MVTQIDSGDDQKDNNRKSKHKNFRKIVPREVRDQQGDSHMRAGKSIPLNVFQAIERMTDFLIPTDPIQAPLMHMGQKVPRSQGRKKHIAKIREGKMIKE